MPDFYDPKDRTKVLKQLRKLITRKTWVQGALVDDGQAWGEDPYYKFCFTGYISSILAPHWGDPHTVEGVTYRDYHGLKYPRTYDGGKDLIEKLALAAWDLEYQFVYEKWGVYKDLNHWAEEMSMSYMDFLIAINDGIPKAGAISRLKAIVTEAIRRNEELGA